MTKTAQLIATTQNGQRGQPASQRAQGSQTGGTWWDQRREFGISMDRCGFVASSGQESNYHPGAAAWWRGKWTIKFLKQMDHPVDPFSFISFYILLYPFISFYILLYPFTSFYILLYPFIFFYILLYPFIHSYFVLRPGPVARVTASSALIEV